MSSEMRLLVAIDGPYDGCTYKTAMPVNTHVSFANGDKNLNSSTQRDTGIKFWRQAEVPSKYWVRSGTTSSGAPILYLVWDKSKIDKSEIVELYKDAIFAAMSGSYRI